MKMTKQEVKEEFKELEGDPEVKGRLQQAQRQLLMQNMPKAVAESDVVITNPTHYAVALKYDREVADSPTVTAKGEDNLAFRIREIAKENNIPIVENRPVARGLYTETEVGDIIPESYYRLVAVIYSQILNKD
jgi:flagellar biosynthetic protein FlhB